jgi:putative SOS response-associated peptidase YedK
MCGRYTLTVAGESLAVALAVEELATMHAQPRFNLSPSELAPVLIAGGVPGAPGPLQAARMRWGFRDGKPTAEQRTPLINARVETVRLKPTFRAAFASRRCLIPADGFIEWTAAGRRDGQGNQGRQPWWIYPASGEVMTFAGIWSPAADEAGLSTFAILTTEARGNLRELHGRMPLVIPRTYRSQWLASAGSATQAMEALERDVSLNVWTEFLFRRVSPQINRAGNEGEHLLDPHTPEDLGSGVDPRPSLGNMQRDLFSG